MTRLQRLDELKGVLKEREHVTASDLAAELGVSLRTVRRDLRLLRETGVPIDSDRGRGGGLRLQRDWALGRMHFSAGEAVDLLLSIAVAERMGSPVLLTHLTSIRRKIVAAFAETHQGKIRALRKRILIGRPASTQIAASYAAPPPRALGAIAEGFFNTRCVQIEYVDQNGTTTSREIEPQFLYLSLPVWYLLAWDRLRGAIRYFRVDRIRSAKMLDAPFRAADPAQYLLEAERGIDTL